mgnify:CR=1 FL=1
MWGVCESVFRADPVAGVAWIEAHGDQLESWVGDLTNAMAERLNGKIQLIKSTARGYHKFENFRNAILFFTGGLNLLP